MTASAKRLIAANPSLLSEAELSGLVSELARLGGWTCRYHTLRSKGSASGFPDWVFVKGERLLFVELKSETGLLSMKQLDWLEGLRAVPGVEVHVWRPSDYDAIVETLTGKKPIEAAA